MKNNLVLTDIRAVVVSGVVLPLHDEAKRAEFWQLVRYVGSAGSVALFYLVVLAIGLALGWHYLLAILAAQVVTIAVAFPVYRTFVFRSHGKIVSDLVRFLSVWASGAIAGVLVTPLLVEVAHLDPLVAQVIAIAVVSVASFLSHRWFSFRRSKPKPEQAKQPDKRPNSRAEGNS